ncbi:hypothetical protein PILCRDRAFT_29815, partial [Piloderma croceum F 1598]
QWRNLQVLKRAGLAHDINRARKPGNLALFCPTCPQPRINVPPKHEWLEEDKLLYRPSYVMDGNFKLEHLKMRRPEDDVALRDSGGHMTTKVLCSNHKPVNDANADQHNLDCTGLGGCAC